MMLELVQVAEILVENCKVASCFFLVLMLVRPLTEKIFSQSWHYLAYRVNLLLFFIPIDWVSKRIAPLVAKLFPMIATQGEVVEQVDFVPYLPSLIGEQVPETFTEASTMDWTGILVSVWLTVGFCVFLWHMYCMLRLHREVRGLSAISCPVIQRFFQKCKEIMGITDTIPLLGSENIYSPVLLGLHHPKILLPVKKVQEKHLEYIFAHELTHLRRKDLWWKSLLTPLTILYWWNPLIYLFNAQFETVLEFSCDEEVVKLRSHEERKCYGKAILESIDEEQTNPVLGVSFRTPEQLLETRLKNMLKFNEMKTKTKVLSGVLMSAMLLGAAAPSIANATAEAKEQSTTPSGKTTDEKDDSFTARFLTLTPENEEFCTPEEWNILLEKVELGEILWFDSIEEEQIYWNNYYNEHPEFLIPDTIEINTFILVDDDKIDEYLTNLTSVNASDEESFAPNVWARILEKVESGEVFFFETRAEEQEWLQNNIVSIHEEGKREWESSSPSIEPIPNAVFFDVTELDEDVVATEASLVMFSVNNEDESRYSPENWAEFMEKVEAGEMLFFETPEEEQEYLAHLWETNFRNTD